MNESSPTFENSRIRIGAATVQITCPTWCGVSAEEHASRLWVNEGRCVHQTVVTVADPAGEQAWAETTRYCPPIELILHVTTDPAGREVESADMLINGQESNLEQLTKLANAIVDLGEMYRATPGRQPGPPGERGKTGMTDSARSLLLLRGKWRRHALPRRKEPIR